MNRNLFSALLCLSAISIITLFSAAGIGFHTIHTVPESIPSSELSRIIEEGIPNLSGPVVYSVEIENNFLPRQYELPHVSACFYNSSTKQGIYAGTHWQLSQLNDFNRENVIRLGREKKSVHLTIEPYARYEYAPSPKIKPVLNSFDFDSILLFIQDPGNNNQYIQCELLQEEDLKTAKRIILSD